MADHTRPYSGPVVTRVDAKAAGARKFYTSKPCQQGHQSQRYVTNGLCVACQRLAHTAWKAANPGAAKAATDAWKEANPGAAVASTRRWQRAHPELVKLYETTRDRVKKRAKEKRYRTRNVDKVVARYVAWRQRNAARVKAYYKAYRSRNPEKIRVKSAARRAREAGAEGSHTGKEILALFIGQGGRCAYCHTPIVLAANRPDSATEDHVVALANGGSNWITNIALACKTCNLRKGAKAAATFASEATAQKVADSVLTR